jgi:hypothetical protein
VEWIQLAENRDRWQALVNTVMEALGSGATEFVCLFVSSSIRYVSFGNIYV